jgi:hypothetical protein
LSQTDRKEPTTPITVRIPFALREQLETDARKSYRTLSQEVRRRLEKSAADHDEEPVAA